MENKTNFIPAKKRNIYIHFTLSLCVLVASIVIFSVGIAEEAFSRTLCIIAAGISGLFCLILMPLVKNRTGILISSDGLSDCTRFSSIGPIPWKDIISFNKETVMVKVIRDNRETGETIRREYIAVKIRQESDFGNMIAQINKNLWPGSGGREILDKYGENTLIINPKMFDMPADELLDILKKDWPNQN